MRKIVFYLMCILLLCTSTSCLQNRDDVVIAANKVENKEHALSEYLTWRGRQYAAPLVEAYLENVLGLQIKLANSEYIALSRTLTNNLELVVKKDYNSLYEIAKDELYNLNGTITIFNNSLSEGIKQFFPFFQWWADTHIEYISYKTKFSFKNLFQRDREQYLVTYRFSGFNKTSFEKEALFIYVGIWGVSWFGLTQNTIE